MGLVQEIKLVIHSGDEVKEVDIPLGDRMPTYAKKMCNQMIDLANLLDQDFNPVSSVCQVVTDDNTGAVKYSIIDSSTNKCIELADTNHELLKTYLPQQRGVNKYIRTYRSMLMTSLGFINYLDELGLDSYKIFVHFSKNKCTLIEVFV